MADINVDVSLPSSTSVNVTSLTQQISSNITIPSTLVTNTTSPTQSLGTNIFIPGPQGPAGHIGPSGVQGPSGLQGLSGLQGPSGLQGLVGPSGIQGPSGLQGPSGEQGPSGLQGLTGPQGATGLVDTGVFDLRYYSINNPNGFITGVDLSSYATINNLFSTGSTLDNKINSLSGVTVLKFGDQAIYGNKTFNDAVYIHDLYVTGDRFIVNTVDTFVESNYLLLNLTGGANDGGIFFVTGTGLTGVNDYGPIIGFDHSNNFKFGIARRSDDLSSLSDIASVQELRLYSGVANNTFATTTNLSTTGSTLNNRIDTLTTNLTSTGVSLGSRIDTLTTNLSTTGSTLNNRIDTLTTNLTSTGVSLGSRIDTLTTNLSTTGDSLYNYIVGFSGNLDNIYATDAQLTSTGVSLGSRIDTLTTNLSTTGSTLDNKINNLSGYINSSNSNIVFTTGNQLINGTKTFNSGVVINVQPTGINPALYITGTWNNASQIYTGIVLDITDTNSSSNSLFMDLRAGGASKVWVDKFGALNADAINGKSPTQTWFSADASRVSLRSQNYIGWSNSLTSAVGTQDVQLFRDAPYTLAQRVGTNPQQFRVYNSTGTNSGEFGLFGWQNNQLVVGSQATSSGISRDVLLTGNNVLISGSNLRLGSDGIIRGFRFIASDTNFPFQAGSVYEVGTDGSRPIVKVRNDGAYSFSSSYGLGTPDILLERDAAGIFAQRNGTNAQQFRVYNSTGTNSGEFGLFGWQNNNLIIGSQATSSGILRNVVITGSEITLSGSAVYIGNDSSSPRGTRLQTQAGGFTIQPNIGGTRQWTLSNTNFVNNGGFSIGATDRTLTLNSNTLVITNGNNLTDQYNGVNPQSLRIFNSTGTNSGEFGLFGWQNNQLVIGSQATNSGILRSVVITGRDINILGNLNVTGIASILNSDGSSAFTFIPAQMRFGRAAGQGGIIFGISNNVLGFRDGNSQSVNINSSYPLTWSSDVTLPGDLQLYRDNSGVLAQRNSVNPQQFRVYNITGTNTGEFGLVGWINSGLVIGPQQTNSGILRDLTLTGNNININASGAFNIFDNTNIVGNLNVTGNIYLSGNPVLTGLDLSSYLTSANASSTYATITNLESTGGNLNTKIDNLSGVSILRFGDQTIAGNKTFDNKLLVNTYTTAGYDASNNDFRLNIGGNTNAGDGILIDSYGAGGSSNVVGRRARGTATNLSGLLKDDLIFLLQARGYSSGAGYIASSRASWRLYAEENWTGTNNHGTYMTFRTTNTGSSTALDKLLINTSGVNILNGNLYLSGNPVLTGIDLSSYATTTNLASTGSTLDSKISSLSGQVIFINGNSTLQGNLNVTGNIASSGEISGYKGLVLANSSVISGQGDTDLYNWYGFANTTNPFEIFINNDGTSRVSMPSDSVANLNLSVVAGYVASTRMSTFNVYYHLRRATSTITVLSSGILNSGSSATNPLDINFGLGGILLSGNNINGQLSIFTRPNPGVTQAANTRVKCFGTYNLLSVN